MSQKIGFVGLGQMGLPMVSNLLKNGFEVIGNDLRKPDTSGLPNVQHFSFVDSALALADQVDVVILMLPDSKVVNGLLWDQGFAKKMKAGSTILDMSSSNPMDSKLNAEKLKSENLHFVDAPVSGGVKKAIDATLSIMIGGEKAAVDKVQPILQALGKALIHVGSAGAGHAVKAINNYVSAAGLIAASEALVAANKFGIDPSLVNQVFNASTGRNNSTENKVEQFMLNEKFNSGFSLALMRKDVETALNFMNSVGIKPDLAERCVSVCQAAEKALPEKADHTAVYQYVKSR